MRARIDVSEIEASTKIRAKYLRALENEEWGLLPGPTFVKSFLRTYAQALGLDGRALVEEYRLHHEHPSDAMMEPIVSPPRGSGRSPGRGPGRGPSRAYIASVTVIGALIVLLIVLLATGGGGSSKHGAHKSTGATAGTGSSARSGAPAGTRAALVTSNVTLSITPTSVVYVCLLGDGGRKLIPGINLQPGETTSTYHAKRFELTLGNNAVTLNIDGRPRTVPASSQAIGYSITKARGRKTLPGGQLPTCK